MEQFTHGLLINVLVAIITALSLYIYKNLFIPYMNNLLYKGVRINRNWELQHIGKVHDQKLMRFKSKTTMTIEQYGGELNGFALTSYEDVTRKDSRYKVSGSISDRVVDLIFINCSEQNFGKQVYLLEVTQNGGRLLGNRAFYGRYEEKIRSVQCEFLEK